MIACNNIIERNLLIKKRKKFLRAAIIILIILSFPAFIFFFNRRASFVDASNTQVISPVPNQETLPKFTPEELKMYDGTNPDLPIYLALDGTVYDITKGSEFYKVGGAYHYLAGRDSSGVLHVIGGDIIKKKYPAIGRFVNTN